MTQEEKELLLKDLCARLPYGVILKTPKGDGYLNEITLSIFDHNVGVNIQATIREYIPLHDCKPYLRPMYSMTEEEEVLFRCELPAIAKTDAQLVTMRMELFLKGHLDFNHLIEKGLALEAPDGMY